MEQVPFSNEENAYQSLGWEWTRLGRIKTHILKLYAQSKSDSFNKRVKHPQHEHGPFINRVAW